MLCVQAVDGRLQSTLTELGPSDKERNAALIIDGKVGCEGGTLLCCQWLSLCAAVSRLCSGQPHPREVPQASFGLQVRDLLPVSSTGVRSTKGARNAKL